MSSKAKHYAASSAARSVTKGHTKAEARKRSRQRYTQSQGLPWLKIAVGAVAVVLIAAFAFSFVNTSYGKISAQSTSYAFGDVPWKGGFVYTQFPITVEGDTTVNDIQST
jgi:hypothetical protein